MGKLKILVVDDESRMRKLVKDFLMKKDFPRGRKWGRCDRCFLFEKRYCTGDSGCYDAENGWMAGMP